MLLLILSVGCISEGKEGYSVPNEYVAEEIASSAGDHQSEFVRIAGIVSRGYVKQGQKICENLYFLEGTNLRLDGNLPNDLEGKTVVVTGYINTPVCSASCECEPSIYLKSYEIGGQSIQIK